MRGTNWFVSLLTGRAIRAQSHRKAIDRQGIAPPLAERVVCLTAASIAGSDTTASALRAIMVHVITSPDIYRHLQAEIDIAVANGRVSFPVADAEARKFPPLQACIKEGFRMWPPITRLMP
ncbi:hypothetical protein EDB80DRAFT_683991 [Ilyonectria destructans]|nr:hypothetical protein EDB80DRAFT_683991 [Ilyonectria destructans]